MMFHSQIWCRNTTSLLMFCSIFVGLVLHLLQLPAATAAASNRLSPGPSGCPAGTNPQHHHSPADSASGDVKMWIPRSAAKDSARIQTHVARVGKRNKRIKTPARPLNTGEFSGHVEATVESGASIGSGEYLIDVYLGTPPKKFSLVLDTGSDLSWLQCAPCHDCFQQQGPFYSPAESNSFRYMARHDPRCTLVSPPETPPPGATANETCQYYYFYGDKSNTTGDFALETFTLNLTTPAGKPELRRAENIMFGCGHWNRGLFHGAAGVLGFGRGPLSFPTQLTTLYGNHSFSYCLVDRTSAINVTNKLVFGDLLTHHPGLNHTSLIIDGNPTDTYYYVEIKAILVGGEVLPIPQETWSVVGEGTGGTIIDSGTTLSYFAQPAYQIIRDSFISRVKKYPRIQGSRILNPCFNISGVKKLDLPEFAILFSDGAEWNFPSKNYFVEIQPGEISCLAILGTPRPSLSIIGNYQQQNFHIVYDTKNARLGFVPRNCADV